MKKLFLVLLSIFLLTGCKDVKLANGENAVVTFKEGAISSDDLYEVLKESYGASNIMNLMDKYLLDKKYETTAEETAYINQEVKNAKEQAKEMNADFDLYLSYYYGVNSEKAFKEQLSLTYKRGLWTEEYAKESVTDKQVKEYYEEEIVGDMEASHILITIDVDDDATESEKDKAEKEAYNKAKDIIAKLKKGQDFSELAKKYSEDEDTAKDGGSLGKVNKDDLNEKVFDALVDLKVGKYTKTPVKSTYGYHIIYKKSQDEKPELTDELTNKIKETIGSELAATSSFGLKALKALREQNEMKFVDTNLEKAFNELIESYELQYQNQ